MRNRGERVDAERVDELGSQGASEGGTRPPWRDGGDELVEGVGHRAIPFS